MGLLITFSIICAIFIAIIVFGYKYENDLLEISGIVGTICSLAVVLIALLCTTTLQADFNYKEAQYNNLKEQIEYCDHDDIVTDGNLRKQVLDMNNTIARHREYCHNYWIGIYYSEHIGSLENLKWKSNKSE